MIRIGFLFNHSAPHQVLHTAPVAFALSRMSPAVEVEILASCDCELAMAGRIGRQWPGHAVRLRRARLPFFLGCLQALRLLKWKRAILRANLDWFAGLDAVVVPERTSVTLRAYPELAHLQLIQIPHGAGDRAIGYEARNREFDLILVAGNKCRRRFISQVGIHPDRVRIIGYPKFEVSCLEKASGLFPENRPTVLYNPHFAPGLSSWPRWGRQVLDWFAAQSRFNVIFAPHVMLYRRPWRNRARPLWRYRGLNHILIDTGSDRCVDMTYTNYADIYLGDVSSQVYEFVREPRPVVFLNANGVIGWRFDVNYRHWQLGSVVDCLESLPSALEGDLTPGQARRQRALVSATFNDTGEPASRRGARAILEHLEGRQPVPEVVDTSAA